MVTKTKIRPKINVSQADAVNILNRQGHRFYSVTFIKKDNTLRLMNGRKGVSVGVNGKGRSYEPSDKGLFGMWDVQKRGHRMVNVNSITSFKAKGNDYTVITPSHVAFR